VKIQREQLILLIRLNADLSDLFVEVTPQKRKIDPAVSRQTGELIAESGHGLIAFIQDVCDYQEIGIHGLVGTCRQIDARSDEGSIDDLTIGDDVIASVKRDSVLLSFGRCGHTYLLSYRGQTGVVVA